MEISPQNGPQPLHHIVGLQVPKVQETILLKQVPRVEALFFVHLETGKFAGGMHELKAVKLI